MEDSSGAPFPRVLSMVVFPELVVLNRSSRTEPEFDPVLKRDEPELKLPNLPSRLKEPELYLSSLTEPLPDDSENRSSRLLIDGERPLLSRWASLADEAL